MRFNSGFKGLILHEHDDDDDVRRAYLSRHAQSYVVQCATSYYESVLPIQLFCSSEHRNGRRDGATVCAVSERMNSDIVIFTVCKSVHPHTFK